MRIATTTSITFALTVILVLGFAPRGHAWTYQFDGDDHERDLVHGLRIGPAGELYVAAAVGDGGAVVKLDPDTGSTLWHYELEQEPFEFLYDPIYAVTTDAAGAVFAAASVNYDFVAIRLDPATGQELWQTRLSGTGNTSYDYAKAIAADGFGGVMVAGAIQDHDGTFAPDLAVVRMDVATGAVLWKSLIDGGSSHDLNRGQEASDVAIAANGDAIAVGYITVHPPGQAFDDRLMVAARFARDDGHEIWRWTYSSGPGLAENFGRHVRLDAAGDVIVCGTHGFLGGAGRAAVFKLAGDTGAELWRYISTGEDSNDVAVDGAGDVVVAGGTNHEAFPPNSFQRDATVSKLDATTGTVVWRRQIPGAGVSEGVAVDAADDVIAVGSHRRAVSAMKLAGSDGHVIWTRQANPRPQATSYWLDVALDGSGRFFAGGATAGPPQSAPEDLYVAGFDETTGAGVGCGNGTLDTGETCDDGNALDFDGCSGTCTVEHCGDGVVDADEQCDDGGNVDGDGCDAHCNFEGCGDGETSPGEQCDDGNRTAVDLCSPTCRIEVCETPNAAPARVSLRRLGGVPGDERMALRIEVTSSPSSTPTNLQLIVDDLGAAGSPVLDLSYRVGLPGIPNGAGCDPIRDVRRIGSRGDSYRNGSDALPPSCAAGSANGFRRMTVKRLASQPDRYVIKAAFQNSSLPTPVGPLQATVVAGENLESLRPGTCWQWAFTPSQCIAGPSTLTCR